MHAIVVAVIGAALLAGCATAPRGDFRQVYDHKYNVTTYAAKQEQSDFIGTSATAGARKATPSWYRYGHP